MGKRLHYATKYIVEYSRDAYFNYNQEHVYNLLCELDIPVYGTDDCWGDNWEIPRDCLESAINSINSKEISIDGFGGYSKDDIVNILNTILQKSDNTSGNSDIYISWF
ncbi:MAG: hypothetical protein ACRDD8_05805 [Bacteroidales bacterium]